MVEPQPSKLIMWVRSPSPAPILLVIGAVETRLWGCETGWQISPPGYIRAHIAQVVEYSLGKGEVTGSNPVMGTT